MHAETYTCIDCEFESFSEKSMHVMCHKVKQSCTILQLVPDTKLGHTITNMFINLINIKYFSLKVLVKKFPVISLRVLETIHLGSDRLLCHILYGFIAFNFGIHLISNLAAFWSWPNLFGAACAVLNYQHQQFMYELPVPGCKFEFLDVPFESLVVW